MQCVCHHFRRLCEKFQSSPSPEHSIPRISHHGHELCIQRILAFKEQAKTLLTSTTLCSLGISAVAILISNTDVPALAIFILNLIAIVPLSVTLTHATESISQDFGEIMGALLNITTGNLAELAIFTTLKKGTIKVVQSSLLGSILVNLLLVLGSSIIAGGLKSPNQTYNSDLTHAFVGLLNLTVSCLMIPNAFYGSLKDVQSADVMALNFSRAVSVILLGVYFLYIFFQLRSHASLFRPATSNHRFQSIVNDRDINQQSTAPRVSIAASLPRPEMQEIPYPASPSPVPLESQVESGLLLDRFEPTETSTSPSFNESPDPSDGYGTPKHVPCNCYRHVVIANRTMSIGFLILSTGLIAICAEYFAASFAILNEQGVLGESFVGLIVIPIAGNVAENVTAVIVASKDQMDLAISVALGSAIQIGLLVAPVIVLIGWVLDKPMTLHFDRFEIVTLIGASLLVSFIFLKGKTNYLEGAILCACFAAIS
ncbi:Sodium/calcium exchanger membrane region [Penicillium riverlandense]|uniref:Sodium/calcium exchanger membrane region n=1 Tax=Penicillium riverlandense TaxID=1903569 RepID=UPI00254910F4|nr:Sodium/calcium exchanger membrane region [Penicillium riverlandense]KAJ5820212.1 Sodium/calcium exchanger membrane region [Penicillium riverlandense]